MGLGSQTPCVMETPLSPLHSLRLVLFVRAVVDDSVSVSSGWRPGPTPFTFGGVAADQASRMTYFDERIQSALFEDDNGLLRFHREVEQSEYPEIPGFTPIAIELLRAPYLLSHDNVVVVHAQLDQDELFSILTSLRHVDPDGPNVANQLIASLVGPVLSEPLPRQRIGTMLFATIRSALPNVFPDAYSDWTDEEQWLWLLSTGIPFEEYPPDVGLWEEIRRQRLELSADWSCLVLRDGTAFLGCRPDLGSEDPFFRSAELYFHSIYTDIRLLGLQQKRGIDALADSLARLADPTSDPLALRSLSSSSARFRNIYWWPHLSNHKFPNDFLAAFQDQHKLKALHEQVLKELDDYSRQVQTAAASRTSALLGLISIVGLPLALVFGFSRTLDISSPLLLLTALVCALIITLIFMLTIGRDLSAPLRSELRLGLSAGRERSRRRNVE